jgi:glycosyltransferase involved in cell wall biosynthesis
MKFSLVVTTLGRVAELERLFEGLMKETCQDFEIIISDQNEDDRLAPLVAKWQAILPAPVIHLKSSGGGSRGRNAGIDRALGEFICFPDDDCVYPPLILDQVIEFFAAHPEFDYLNGRSIWDDGGDAVSKHSKQAGRITRYRIYSQCIEFAMFFRRARLGALRLDETMGPGAPTPWQADEGPDYLLRLEEHGLRGYYDPSFAIWHPRPIRLYDARDIDRTYRYACGNGYFYRKNNYPGWFFGYQLFRAFGGFLLGLATLRMGRTKLYAARLRGCWRGWNYRRAAGA